jgi:putative ABC transport system permease protein
MAVRERIPEYGTLRAMGFSPRLLTRLIVGEAAVLGALGGVVGVGLATLSIRTYLGRYLEEAMNLNHVEVTWQLALTCLAAASALGALAAALPAYRMNKLEVTSALRDIG